jgi:hypothetical protein
MRFLNARNSRIDKENQRQSSSENDLSWVDEAAKAPPPTMGEFVQGMSMMMG